MSNVMKISSDDFYLSEQDSSVDEQEKLDIFISFRGFIVLYFWQWNPVILLLSWLSSYIYCHTYWIKAYMLLIICSTTLQDSKQEDLVFLSWLSWAKWGGASTRSMTSILDREKLSWYYSNAKPASIILQTACFLKGTVLKFCHRTFLTRGLTSSEEYWY